jgi:hypothetical protein
MRYAENMKQVNEIKIRFILPIEPNIFLGKYGYVNPSLKAKTISAFCTCENIQTRVL